MFVASAKDVLKRGIYHHFVLFYNLHEPLFFFFFFDCDKNRFTWVYETVIKLFTL